MTAPLRVGMNLLWLVPGVVGGSEVAAVGTVEGIVEHAHQEVDLRLYAQPSFRSAYPLLTRRVPTRTVAPPYGSRPSRVAVETLWLPRAVRRDRVDVVHFLGGVVPAGFGRPNVLTVHDVQPLEDGSAFGRVKKQWLARMIPASVARASVVVVPSSFVRERLLDLVPVHPDKVVVVPHGLTPAASDATRGAADDAALLRRRFRIDGPFALFPAITYPHKNHEVLIRAFAVVARRRDDVSLVLTGGAGEAEQDVNLLVERLGIGSRVRRVGRVTHDELATLLREAQVMAFPSRYEGFGLPVLEAFGADTPVIASTAGSLPEVVGDAGVLIDPDDVDAWADALCAVFDGAEVEVAASAKRNAQAARFSWERAARTLVGLYQKAASTSGEGQ